MLSEEDENGIAAAKMAQPAKVYVMPYNPTAENMARYLLEQICPELLADEAVKTTKVVIWETKDSFAEAAI